MDLTLPAYGIKKRDGQIEPLNADKLLATLNRAGVESEPVSVKTILKETSKNIYDGVPSGDLETALVLAASTFIERDTAYSALYQRLVESGRVPVPGPEVLAAERAVVAQAFKGSRSAYISALKQATRIRSRR